MRGRIKEQEQQKRRTTNINIEITMFHLNAAVLCLVVGSIIIHSVRKSQEIHNKIKYK